MKTLSIWINRNTALALFLSVLSSWVCVRFQWALRIDFLMIGLLVVFPLTLGVRLAFRRREMALRYLARHRSSLLAIANALSLSKLDRDEYAEAMERIARSSDELLNALAMPGTRQAATFSLRDSLPEFLRLRKKPVKSGNVHKLMLFHEKTDESISALLAIKRHGTPVGLRPFMLFALITFLLFYPASLLAEAGLDAALWYVTLMTAFKGVLLATFYNVYDGLEDPFVPGGLDSVKLEDFRLRLADLPVWMPPAKKNKDDKDEDEDE